MKGEKRVKMWILARRLSEKLIFKRARSQKVPKIVPKNVKMEPWGDHGTPFGDGFDPKDALGGHFGVIWSPGGSLGVHFGIFERLG